MEYYNLAPAAFAEQIGINRSNLTHLFSGRNQPSLDLAKKILQYFPNIKTEWLIMGVGEMFRSINDKELIKTLQNEKQSQVISEPDLFTSTPPQSSTAGESHVAKQTSNSTQIINSREVERVEPPILNNIIENETLPPHPTSNVTKIVFFYSDNSFEIFHPALAFFHKK